MRNYRTTDFRRSALLFVPIALIVFATNAFAHAVVFPRTAAPGAYEKYVLRVPNERDVATTRVEIRFPADVRVVSFSDVAGWKLEVVSDSARRIVGAVWTGRLAAERFVEFPFVAVNPKTAATLVWPAFQTYADGERVEWTGPEGSDKPASVTVLTAADAPAAAGSPQNATAGGVAPTTAAASNASDGPAMSIALPVSMLALVLAMVALGLALRNRKTD